MTAKKNRTKLMKGSLWFVYEREDGSDSPISLKEFKNNIERDEPSAKLSKGRIIPKQGNADQQLIFDCVRIEDDETSSFRLLLREDGTVSGKIEFPLYDGEPVEYFKGDYLIKNNKITIWGVWDMDFEVEDLHSIFIELKKTIDKDEELIYDEDDAVEFIRENISEELNEKLDDKEIIKLLDLANEYIETEYQKNEKRKPYFTFDLSIIQENVNDYVFKNSVQHNIFLNIEEIEEIMYAEIEYMQDAGIAGEDNILFLDN